MFDEIVTAIGHRQTVRDWLSRDEPAKGVGLARCAGCGGQFIEARVADGLRFAFEAAADGGDWSIVGDLAKPDTSGEYVIHNCRRTR